MVDSIDNDYDDDEEEKIDSESDYNQKSNDKKQGMFGDNIEPQMIISEKKDNPGEFTTSIDPKP